MIFSWKRNQKIIFVLAEVALIEKWSEETIEELAEQCFKQIISED